MSATDHCKAERVPGYLKLGNWKLIYTLAPVDLPPAPWEFSPPSSRMWTPLLFWLVAISTVLGQLSNPSPVPIVYIFLISSPTCQHYPLPPYLWSSLNQSVNFQHPDIPILFVTDAINCSSTYEALRKFSRRIDLIDASKLNSMKSSKFSNSTLIGRAELNLYVTSLQRFFILEDLMNLRKYSQVFHVEADNLLYFSLKDMLPVLQSLYPQITVTPLNVDERMTTASVVWIPSIETLSNFTTFVLQLLNTESEVFKGFRALNEIHSRCTADHDRCILKINGVGMKLYSLNEMTFLAYYKYLYPQQMLYFALLPPISPVLELIKGYTINGSHVGNDTLGGVWDSGSWGQYVDGTPPGRNAIMLGHTKAVSNSFVSDSSIIGLAILNHKCHLKRHCSVHFKFEKQCLTAPSIRCEHEANRSFTPLWNLHVHSKRTSQFQSIVCECPDSLSPQT